MRRNDTMGIILSSTENIPPITDKRSADALTIAGRYRVIDFVISCMSNAGIQNIGIATSFNYSSLMQHLRVGEPWDLDRKTNGLTVLPPNVEKPNASTFRGTIDMLDGIRNYIKLSKQTYVVLSLDNGIYNIDFGDAVESHIQRQADITLIYKDKKEDNLPESEFSRFTLLHLDADERVTDIAIKPSYPDSTIVAMGLVIMEKALLESIIDECVARCETDFLRDAIVKKLDAMRIFGYKYTGVATKIDSMKSYYEANMNFLKEDFRDAIFDSERPVFTRSTAQSPTVYGEDAIVDDCFVSDGCKIEGNVSESILSRMVTIEKGATVKNSILFHNCIIEEGAVVENVVLDRSVHITKGRKLIGTKSYPLAISEETVI